MNYCMLCQAKRLVRCYLCLSCYDSLQALRLDEDALQSLQSRTALPILSFYSYQAPLRGLILHFKASGLLIYARLLRELWREALAKRLALSDYDGVLAAPSSAWSRARGHPDLAYLLAEECAQLADRPLLKVPRMLMLKKQKMAFMKGWQRHEQKSEELDEKRRFGPEDLGLKKQRDGLKILLIDDVVTTANTLTDFSERFTDIRFAFCTLSAASLEARIEP